MKMMKKTASQMIISNVASKLRRALHKFLNSVVFQVNTAQVCQS